MIPIGYMAKRVHQQTDRVKVPHVLDIYSVSDCISENFADYIPYWKHNGYWLFDSPELIKQVARESSAELDDTHLFYYEAYDMEFDGSSWRSYVPEPSFPTSVIVLSKKKLEGFDVVTFHIGTSPECSPLSCNLKAKDLDTNAHCLFSSFDRAKSAIDSGSFKDAEPGPYRIFSGLLGSLA